MKTELAVIWKSVLNRDSVGDEDDFFALGGDSAIALAMLLQIEDDLNLYLEPAIVYENSSFGAFVTAVEKAREDGSFEDF